MHPALKAESVITPSATVLPLQMKSMTQQLASWLVFGVALAGGALPSLRADLVLLQSDFDGGVRIFRDPLGATAHASEVFISNVGTPVGLLEDPAGNLYIAGGNDGTIYFVANALQPGPHSAVVFARDQGRSLGLALDGEGSLYVSDGFGGKINRFRNPLNPGPHVPEVFAAGLQAPEGLVFDAAGRLWEADADSGNINVFTDVAAAGLHQPTVFASGLPNVVHLVFDREGNLFVSCFDSDITRFDHATAPGPHPRTVIGTGLRDSDGLTLGPDGRLYVSDFWSGRVCVFAQPDSRSAQAPEIYAARQGTPSFLLFCDTAAPPPLPFTVARDVVPPTVASTDSGTPEVAPDEGGASLSGSSIDRPPVGSRSGTQGRAARPAPPNRRPPGPPPAESYDLTRNQDRVADHPAEADEDRPHRHRHHKHHPSATLP